MTEFDPKWPHGHTTRDGKEARIYALDGAGSYPIHGAIKVGEKWEGRQWQINGSWRMGSRADATDLINAQVERWGNIYDNDGLWCAFHDTLDKANAGFGADDTPIARIKITLIGGKPVSAEIVEA
jgi:hypothetical protein